VGYKRTGTRSLKKVIKMDEEILKQLPNQEIANDIRGLGMQGAFDKFCVSQRKREEEYKRDMFEIIKEACGDCKHRSRTWKKMNVHHKPCNRCRRNPISIKDYYEKEP
jgi:hypothetical protein